jgi:hypothetical protein
MDPSSRIQRGALVDEVRAVVLELPLELEPELLVVQDAPQLPRQRVLDA